MENSMTSNNLDMHLIVAAFETLAIPNNPQSISRADKYIIQCQKNPYFSMTLINILSQLPNSQTKFQILIHLKNVIKRNWTSKRRTNQSSISQQMKEQIKAKLIDLYKQNWKIYYKQFNQIFKELSRFDFPKNYHLLNVFVFQVLTSLSILSIDQMLSSQQLLPYLSLVKVIYKEFGQRRILHTQQSYNKYIAKNIQISSNIMHKINDALLSIKINLHQVDPELGIKLLECSRKIDKIILYCLQSIVPSLQFDPKIRQIVKFQLGKIQTLATIQSNAFNQQVQLNTLAILEGVSKLQQLFPLLFTQYLHQYLQLILQLLLQKNPKQQKLINCIIKSNIKPLKTFTYYMSVQEYKATLEYKMNNVNINDSQNICHNTFKTVYCPDNVGLFLEKIVGDLMNRYSRANEEDQIIFQDAEHTHEGTNQQGTFQLLVTLLKTIISTFPQQSKIFISKLINHLLSQQIDLNSKQVQNMYQIILMLPKIMQQMELNINMATIYTLMQRCYTNYKFDLFCRLIRNYNTHFDSDTLSKSFDILIDIIGNNEVQHFTMYQCAVCIRRIIAQHQQLPFNFDKIGSCLVKILQLIEIYKLVPSHLWNLINLLISFLKSFSENVIILNLVQLSACINMILSTKFQNNSMIISAICDLLQNLLTLINPNDNNNLQQKLTLYNSAINLLICYYKKGTQQEQSIEQDKNFLWLCIIKNINVNQVPIQMKDQMVILFQNLKESVIEEQPSLFLQILEEYYIGGFVQLSLDDLNSLYTNLVQNSEPDTDIRINMGFFTLYLSFSLMTNNFDQGLLMASMGKLKQIFKRVSPTLNSLRTLLMLIISYSMIFVGAEKVIQLFNEHQKDYKQWFYPFIWSLQYINNRYSAKVTSIAILRSLGLLKNVLCQLIEGNLPFDFIIKFITHYVQPIQIDQAINGYSISLRMFSHHEQLRAKNRTSGNKIQSRKAKLHVNANFCELNLAPIYKNDIGLLFKEWDWGVDDLQERYTDGLIQKITGLLNS